MTSLVIILLLRDHLHPDHVDHQKALCCLIGSMEHKDINAITQIQMHKYKHTNTNTHHVVQQKALCCLIWSVAVLLMWNATATVSHPQHLWSNHWVTLCVCVTLDSTLTLHTEYHNGCVGEYQCRDSENGVKDHQLGHYQLTDQCQVMMMIVIDWSPSLA